ncbi:MAG: hypothetical protein AAFX09_08175 [Pseudomonadota bacterium]
MALHVRYRVEPSICVAFQAFTNNRGARSIWDENLSLIDFDELVADRRSENVASALDTRGHALNHCAAILFAFELTLGRKNSLDELTFWRVIKTKVQALRACTSFGERTLEREVEITVAGKTFKVIEDDDKILVWFCVEIREQRHHARAVHEVAAA